MKYKKLWLTGHIKQDFDVRPEGKWQANWEPTGIFDNKEKAEANLMHRADFVAEIYMNVASGDISQELAEQSSLAEPEMRHGGFCWEMPGDTGARGEAI